MPVCHECLGAVPTIDTSGVCPPCRDRLRLETEFERGWRAGWSAALDIHGLIGNGGGDGVAS